MRPKQLQFPYSWEERRPLVHEEVLVIPRYFDRHELFDFSALVPAKRSLAIEYCSGNGDWVVERAQKESQYLWVAVERQFARVRKIWSKMRNQGVDNLLIVCGEALTFTKHYLQSSSVDAIYVNFPDPWPKQRHAKHRLIQRPFVDALSRVAKRQAQAVYATDDPNYASQIIAEMEGNPSWQTLLPDPFFTYEWENYGRSWFQELWERKGRKLHFIQYVRT